VNNKTWQIIFSDDFNKYYPIKLFFLSFLHLSDCPHGVSNPFQFSSRESVNVSWTIPGKYNVRTSDMFLYLLTFTECGMASPRHFRSGRRPKNIAKVYSRSRL